MDRFPRAIPLKRQDAWPANSGPILLNNNCGRDTTEDVSEQNIIVPKLLEAMI
jgi:hypothetical protein